jgi:TonB family protein
LTILSAIINDKGRSLSQRPGFRPLLEKSLPKFTKHQETKNMKFVFLPRFKKPISIFLFTLLMSLIFSLTIVMQTGQAQQAQLSLADILIGLRSKKVTLAERNTLLTDAVKARGITFSLTPEIEKELTGTGASAEFIEAIRQKSPKIITASTPQPTPSPTPIPMPIPTPTPPAPDFAFYQKRAGAHLFNKEYDLAIAEYNKAVELNSEDPSIYLNRGFAFLNRKNYDLAVADYDKAIELSPKESMIYFNRGDLHEKMGNPQKAIVDYQKAFELDATNEPAKTNLQRLQAEQAKTAPKTPNNEVSSTSAAKPPAQQIVNVGALNSLAVRLAMPVYTANDRLRNIQGLVTVQVTIDEQGKVISAKATVGHQSLRLKSEEAARNSKFKPIIVGNRAVKVSGFINYNFKAN